MTSRNVESHSNIATRKITQRCGRCDGSGLYYLTASSTGPCFGCSGRGLLTTTQAAWSKIEAQKIAAAVYVERERAEQIAEELAADQAAAAIGRKGVAGAREFFAANRANRIALHGLILAMRDNGLGEEANAVVRYNNAHN